MAIAIGTGDVVVGQRRVVELHPGDLNETSKLEKSTKDADAMRFIKRATVLLNGKPDSISLPSGPDRYVIVRYSGDIRQGTLYFADFFYGHQGTNNQRVYNGPEMSIELGIPYRIPDEMKKLEVAKIYRKNDQEQS